MKNANWTQLALSRHSGIASAPEQVKWMKSEPQLVDSLTRIPHANRDEQVHRKAAASAIIEKAAAMKLQKRRGYVSNLTIPEIRELNLFCFKTEKVKQVNKEMVVHTFAVLMETPDEQTK